MGASPRAEAHLQDADAQLVRRRLPALLLALLRAWRLRGSGRSVGRAWRGLGGAERREQVCPLREERGEGGLGLEGEEDCGAVEQRRHALRGEAGEAGADGEGRKGGGGGRAGRARWGRAGGKRARSDQAPRRRRRRRRRRRAAAHPHPLVEDIGPAAAQEAAERGADRLEHLLVGRAQLPRRPHCLRPHRLAYRALGRRAQRLAQHPLRPLRPLLRPRPRLRLRRLLQPLLLRRLREPSLSRDATRRTVSSAPSHPPLLPPYPPHPPAPPPQPDAAHLRGLAAPRLCRLPAAACTTAGALSRRGARGADEGEQLHLQPWRRQLHARVPAAPTPEANGLEGRARAGARGEGVEGHRGG